MEKGCIGFWLTLNTRDIIAQMLQWRSRPSSSEVSKRHVEFDLLIAVYTSCNNVLMLLNGAKC